MEDPSLHSPTHENNHDNFDDDMKHRRSSAKHRHNLYLSTDLGQKLTHFFGVSGSYDKRTSPARHEEDNSRQNRSPSPPRVHLQITESLSSSRLYDTPEKSTIGSISKTINMSPTQSRREPCSPYRTPVASSPTKTGNVINSSSIWEPPVSLQKTDRNGGYPLFFPLELSNKDYLRRILDICALGIRCRTLEIIAERQWNPIASMHDGDIYYLLQYLLGEYDVGISSNNRSRVLELRQQFADSLGVIHTDKLVNAAKCLFEHRKQLNNVTVEKYSQMMLQCSFTCGTELLECFGKSAMVALNRLYALMTQHKEHEQFKQRRLTALGWQGNHVVLPSAWDNVLAEEEEKRSGVYRVVDDAKQLLHQLTMEMQPANRSLLQLALRLEVYMVALQTTISWRVHQKDLDMANQLQGVRYAIQLLVSQHQLNERLERLRKSFLPMTKAVIARLIALEELTTRREAFHSPVTGALALRELKDSLISAKRALSSELRSFPIQGLEKPFVVVNGRRLWLDKVNGSSLLGLTKAANHLMLLRDAHSLWCRGDGTDGHSAVADGLSFDVSSLHAAGYTAWELTDAGYTVAELKAVGVRAEELSCYHLAELMMIGYSLDELKTAGYPLAEFMKEGYRIAELKRTGFKASEFLNAGCSLSLLAREGFTIEELDAPHNVFALMHAGYPAVALVNAGYTTTDFNDHLREAVSQWIRHRTTAETCYGSITMWDVSQVTDMQHLFRNQRSFNDNISQWDVRQVTTMRGMFHGAVSFNQPLSKWIVDQVTDISHMFNGASSFNQSLSTWNVRKVVDMSHLLDSAISFNQPLHTWQVDQVTSMRCTFYGASSFNQPLSSWNVHKVTTMYGMFHGASSFNQPLDAWDVRHVTNMYGMFFYAACFNQSLDTWDMRNVIDQRQMLDGTLVRHAPPSVVVVSSSPTRR